MEATYRFCADVGNPLPVGDDQHKETMLRLEHAAEALRKYRLKDSIGPLYDVGYYDGIEHAIATITQALKD